MERLDGMDVVVVGAGSGIGRAVALGLAAAGASVTACGRDLDHLRTTRERAVPGLRVQSLDVTDAGSVRSAISAVVDRAGKIDGLVNAAGVANVTASEDLDDDVFQHVLEVNLVGAFRLSREVAGPMLAAGRGSIVHFGSLTSAAGLARRAAYTSSKHGVLGLVRTLAAEWGDRGVRVNALSPGWVRTPLTDRAVAQGALQSEEIERGTPLGRWAEPEEMVEPVGFLLGHGSRFVTGAELVVDGGWRAAI